MSAAERDPQAVAFVDGATTLTWSHLVGGAVRTAEQLTEAGCRAGDIVPISLPDGPGLVAAVAAIQSLGAIAAPLAGKAGDSEIAGVLERTGAELVVTDRSMSLPASATTLLAADPATWAAADQGLNVTGLDPDAVADLMFTSGTTGAPKGAIFDHRRSLGGGRAWANISRQTEDDRYCVFGPFSHNASYKAGWVAGLMTGSTLYWPEAYDAVSILDLIASNRITVMAAPPTVFQEMLAHPNWRDWDISSYRFLSTGATVVPIELMKRLQAETSIREITTGYGMTECCGSATHTRPGDPMERVAYTVGTAIEGTEIAIAGPDGRPAAVGEQGEVLIRDDKLLIEYLDNPEATRATLDAEGWLHSGDVGYLDAEGYLRLTDRLKDMYIVGGFNVYPAEIEKQMSGLPGIFQSAIVGVPDQRLGEVGHAFIVRDAGSTLTAEEVLAWSKANLANYKVPRGVTFIDALPMNSTGKVIKYALKELLQSN